MLIIKKRSFEQREHLRARRITKTANILITGNSGFVGSNLDPYLRNSGFNTIGISRSSQTNGTIQYNALDLEIWNNSYAMVHLAGKAHELKNTADSRKYFEVNTELTKNVFDQFLKSNCEIFIYMSSVKAVADSFEGILSEEIKANPITAYGKSKLAAEKYLLSQKLPKGKKLYILRPCMIHGPENNGNINVLFSMAKKGIPFPFGLYKNQRSFLSVENLSFVIKEILRRQPASGIYNVSDDEFLSTEDLYLSMGQVLDKKLKVFKVAKGFIKLAGKIGDVIPIPINSDKIQKLTENYRVSNNKIKKALEIQKLPLSATDGIIKTILTFQKYKNNDE